MKDFKIELTHKSDDLFTGALGEEKKEKVIIFAEDAVKGCVKVESKDDGIGVKIEVNKLTIIENAVTEFADNQGQAVVIGMLVGDAVEHTNRKIVKNAKMMNVICGTLGGGFDLVDILRGVGNRD